MPVSDFGRLGRDTELKYTQDGTAVCNIAVAVDYGRKGQDGNKPTQWYDLTLWGKQAEALAQYLTKGKQIFFTASDLHIETFTKNDQSQGFKLTGRIDSIKFASDGGNQQPAQQAPQQQRPAPPPGYQPAQPGNVARQPAPQHSDSTGGFNDDIPFARVPSNVY